MGSVTAGVISGINRTITLDNGREFRLIQTDAAINRATAEEHSSIRKDRSWHKYDQNRGHQVEASALQYR